MTNHRYIAIALGALSSLLAAAPAYAEGLQNPLQYDNITSFIAGALKALVVIALPIITLFIVISGFMFVFARGNPSKLAEAKKNFLFVILGAILILGAWVLATLIGGTVSQVIGN